MDPRCLPLLFLLLAASFSAAVASDEIHVCGGFVEVAPALPAPLVMLQFGSLRLATDGDWRIVVGCRRAPSWPSRGRPRTQKFDYSHITVELCTVDGLLKESTQCAPSGYYFIPVYDKGSFMVRVKGPKGWSWKETVPVVIDQNGCNGNADINFQFTGFMISGKVLGAVGGKSCLKDGGPSVVKVELMSDSDELVASALTSSTGKYTFGNIIPGRYKLHASHPDYDIEMRGSPEVDLQFGNAVADDVFFESG